MVMEQKTAYSSWKSKSIFIAFLVLVCAVAVFIMYKKEYKELNIVRIAGLANVHPSEDVLSQFTARFALFDGEKAQRWTSPDTIQGQAKAKELYELVYNTRGEKVSNWTEEKLTYPIYSISFCSTERGENSYFSSMIWSNGYIITNHGANVYKYKDIFEPFRQVGETLFPYEEIDPVTGDGMLSVLARIKDHWNTGFLQESFLKGSSQPDLRFTLDSCDVDSKKYASYIFYEKMVTLTLENTGIAPIYYGASTVHIEIQIDGRWYDAPLEPIMGDKPSYDNLVETINPGEKTELYYSVSQYEYLPEDLPARAVFSYNDENGTWQYVTSEFLTKSFD